MARVVECFAITSNSPIDIATWLARNSMCHSLETPIRTLKNETPTRTSTRHLYKSHIHSQKRVDSGEAAAPPFLRIHMICISAWVVLCVCVQVFKLCYVISCCATVTQRISGQPFCNTLSLLKLVQPRSVQGAVDLLGNDLAHRTAEGNA